MPVLLAFMIASVSCGKDKGPDDNKPTKTPELKVTPAEPAAVSYDGGTISLTVFANMDWKVQDVPSWITVSPESGMGSNYKQPVTVTVEKNNGGMREATLVFAIDGATSSVKITQGHGFGSDAPSNALFFARWWRTATSLYRPEWEYPRQSEFYRWRAAFCLA